MNANLDPKTFDELRLQVRSESGEWMTIVSLGRHGRHDDGSKVEMPYWPRFVEKANGLLNVDLLA